MSDFKPLYSGPGLTGICVCGHGYRDHHIGMVMNEEYGNVTGEWEVPQECEAFGFNETGGMDELGNYHCGQYVDSGSRDQ
jgi:hypothetical protein